MKTDIKDTSYCIQGNHSVPREQMTVVRANGVNRRMCEFHAGKWHDDKKARNALRKPLQTLCKEG